MRTTHWPSPSKAPALYTLFGTLPKMIGKGTHITCCCRASHGDSVAGRQYKRLDPCDRGNRLLCCSPTPGRVPWWSGESLLVAPQTPQQKPPQGIEIHSHQGIACDQDAVTGRKKETWPGVWPGVGMHSQSGRPGIPVPGSNTRATSLKLDSDSIDSRARFGKACTIGRMTHRSRGGGVQRPDAVA